MGEEDYGRKEKEERRDEERGEREESEREESTREERDKSKDDLVLWSGATRGTRYPSALTPLTLFAYVIKALEGPDLRLVSLILSEGRDLERKCILEKERAYKNV